MKKNKLQYERTAEFNRDLKKLIKKFPSLNDDLDIAQKNAIELKHAGNPDHDDYSGIVKIPGYKNDTMVFYKLRRFACKELKGKGSRSGIRIIYAYHLQENKITYLEIYFKGDKENENPERIKLLCLK